MEAKMAVTVDKEEKHITVQMMMLKRAICYSVMRQLLFILVGIRIPVVAWLKLATDLRNALGGTVKRLLGRIAHC
jgi:hypothetical protein